jgi:hypothetical protein
MSPLVLLLPLGLWLLNRVSEATDDDGPALTPSEAMNPKVKAARDNLASVTARVRREAQYARAGSAQYELNLMDLANARRDLDAAIAEARA